MAHIFLDESGDLGFKKTSSKWFIFTIVLTNNHKKGDYEYYDDIKDKIIEEKQLFS